MSGFGTAAYFDRLADELGDDWDWRSLHRVRVGWCLEAIRRFGRPRYSRALDLGCGYGHFAGRLSPFCGEVLGVDGVAAALERAAARYPQVRFQKTRLEDLDFPDARFDLITAVEALYYLPLDTRRALLEKIVRWLVPGGDLLIAARLKPTPHWTAADADSLVPADLTVVAQEDLHLGVGHRAEAFFARAARWGARRGLGPFLWPAELVCRWDGWLRAGAALLRGLPERFRGASTYRLWLARKAA